jgi:hypothetical protein
MTPAILLSAFFSLQAAQPAPPAFQPRPTVRFQPAPRVHVVQHDQDERTIVCGMVVMRKSAEADAKMIIPPRDTGAVVRRIEPRACGAAQTVTPK